MTAPEPHAGTKAPDPGRFEPIACDLGITDDPDPQGPRPAGLWAAQNAPRIANAAGCTDAEYERLLDVRQQAEAAYLARWGSLTPEPRTEAELAAAARAEAWGPQSPVPYSLTPAAEAALPGNREIEMAFQAADEFFGHEPGTADRVLADWEIGDPEAAYDLAADVLDEWDSSD